MNSNLAAAALGSLMGSATSILTTWMKQRTQSVRSQTCRAELFVISGGS
jgi:hypothetical protein